MNHDTMQGLDEHTLDDLCICHPFHTTGQIPVTLIRVCEKQSLSVELGCFRLTPILNHTYHIYSYTQ